MILSKKREILFLSLIAGGTFILLTVISLLFPRFLNVDGPTFLAWGNIILDSGLQDFYTNVNTDYPPLTLLLISCFSWIAKACHMNMTFTAYVFKLPGLIALAASVFVIYYLLREFKHPQKKSLWIAAALGFAPMLLANVLWTQYDTILILGLMVALLLYIRKHYLLVLTVSIIVTLFKLHFAFFFAPLLCAAVFYQMFKQKKLLRLGLFIGGCVLAVVVIYLPFMLTTGGSVSKILHILTEPLLKRNSYLLTGLNTLFMFKSINGYMLPSWYGIINWLIILSIIIGTIYMFIKNPTDINLVLLTAFCNTALFMLTPGMLERYMVLCMGAMFVATQIINRKNLFIVNYYFYFAQFANAMLVFGNRVQSILGTCIAITSTVVFGLFVYEVIKFQLKLKKEKSLNRLETQKDVDKERPI